MPSPANKKMNEPGFCQEGTHKNRHLNIYSKSDDRNTHRIFWRQQRGLAHNTSQTGTGSGKAEEGHSEVSLNDG